MDRRKSTMVAVKCKKCGKKFKTYPCRIRTGKKFCSKKCYFIDQVKNLIRGGKKTRYPKGHVSANKLRPEIMPRGKSHSHWKGEKVGYRGLHYWLRREKGAPKKCVDCKATSDQRKIQWSNVDGKYHRHIDDYVGRCASCHKIHDLKLKQKHHG